MTTEERAARAEAERIWLLRHPGRRMIGPMCPTCRIAMTTTEDEELRFSRCPNCTYQESSNLPAVLNGKAVRHVPSQ